MYFRLKVNNFFGFPSLLVTFYNCTIEKKIKLIEIW